MGQVMRRAVQVDDQHYCSVKERLAQLEVMCCTISDSSLELCKSNLWHISTDVLEEKCPEQDL